jgi:mRNA interferase MazF
MSTSRLYVPDRGHLIWLDFDPQAGREQSGHRPALVLSREDFNLRTGLVFVVPITSRVKGCPDEQPLPSGLAIQGVLLCDQTKSVDWRARNVRFVGTAPIPLVNAIAVKVYQLVIYRTPSCPVRSCF